MQTPYENNRRSSLFGHSNSIAFIVCLWMCTHHMKTTAVLVLVRNFCLNQPCDIPTNLWSSLALPQTKPIAQLRRGAKRNLHVSRLTIPRRRRIYMTYHLLSGNLCYLEARTPIAKQSFIAIMRIIPFRCQVLWLDNRSMVEWPSVELSCSCGGWKRRDSPSFRMFLVNGGDGRTRLIFRLARQDCST